MKIKEGLPKFFDELEAALVTSGATEILEQLPLLEIVDRCSCDEHGCATFRVAPARALNVVEEKVIGGRYAGSKTLDDIDGLVVLDLDNFGRVTTIEVLGRPDVVQALDDLKVPKRAVERPDAADGAGKLERRR